MCWCFSWHQFKKEYRKVAKWNEVSIKFLFSGSMHVDAMRNEEMTLIIVLYSVFQLSTNWRTTLNWLWQPLKRKRVKTGMTQDGLRSQYSEVNWNDIEGRIWIKLDYYVYFVMKLTFIVTDVGKKDPIVRYMRSFHQF